VEYQRFVSLRAPIWDRFEQALARAEPGGGRRLKHAELEQLTFDYRRVLHDHALAGARYPGTSAAHRIQRLAAAGTRLLQRDRSHHFGGLRLFLTSHFPDSFRRRLPEIGVVVALFLAVALLGLGLTLVRPGLAQAFLGTDALEGLQQGRLWTEEIDHNNAPGMTAWIGTNNIRVALLGWAGGLTAGFLTVFLVFYNGLMLGSVIGLTLHYSMTAELLEFISAHGPLEITMILVCSAAGLVMARGLVASDDRPRSESLRAAARDSFVLLAGCLPWLALLAAVESFVSPNPAFAPSFKLGVGLALEALFLLFAFNPFRAITQREAARDDR
jgi:uncharacterized membrane protein SpoIIM required for sporulation